MKKIASAAKALSRASAACGKSLVFFAIHFNIVLQAAHKHTAKT
jgi:hypothetical protein